jgi:hypothetical protein
VYLALHLITERLIYELMLLHHGLVCERSRYDDGLEVLTVPGYTSVRSREALFNQLLDLRRFHQPKNQISSRIPPFQGTIQAYVREGVN